MKEKDSHLIEWLLIGVIILIFSWLIVQDCSASGYETKTDTGVIYGYGMGLHGMEALKMNVTYATNAGNDNILNIDTHGGGGVQGSRNATGTVPINKGNTSKYGDCFCYIDYPLGVTGTTPVTLKKGTIEEMYRTTQAIAACARFMAMPENALKYHVNASKIILRGVSWGAGASFCFIHPPKYSEYTDTTKWFNNSNPGYKFNIIGVVGISGFLFADLDVDTSDIPMIVLHGGKDVLIKCDSGTVKGVFYLGGCRINYLSNQYENPIYFKYFPNGEHGFKVKNNPLATLLNLNAARKFINDSVNLLRK